ncbi:transposable element Tc1 transposase [Trichonephila clavipes]|nr:transposable element Tc1 transposase [Trichonephila clavipes]
MQPLEDAGKNGWTLVDFSVMMVAVDQEQQQIGRCLATNLVSNCPDDNRRLVGRRPGQRVIVDSTPGVMVWGVISFESRTSLVVIRGTRTAQRLVDDILRTVLLLFLLQYPGLIFSAS